VGESWQADAAATVTEHIKAVHSIVFVFIQAGVRSTGPSSLHSMSASSRRGEAWPRTFAYTPSPVGRRVLFYRS
jgi:hypothetical protein